MEFYFHVSAKTPPTERQSKQKHGFSEECALIPRVSDITICRIRDVPIQIPRLPDHFMYGTIKKTTNYSMLIMLTNPIFSILNKHFDVLEQFHVRRVRDKQA